MRGEKIYEYDVDFMGVKDHGLSLKAILSGKEKIPPQGTRLDVSFDGRSNGRLSGRVSGIDYQYIRADGRIDLEIRGTFETDDGQRIALSTSGVLIPRASEPIGDVFENVSLNTVAADYTWVNTRQIWAFGTVNFATGKVHIDAFMQ